MQTQLRAARHVVSGFERYVSAAARLSNILKAALDIDPDLTEDVLTAVGEALVNVVEHAYGSEGPGEIELFPRIEDDNVLSVDVYDRAASA